jgi:hypothetical protein
LLKIGKLGMDWCRRPKPPWGCSVRRRRRKRSRRIISRRRRRRRR